MNRKDFEKAQEHYRYILAIEARLEQLRASTSTRADIIEKRIKDYENAALISYWKRELESAKNCFNNDFGVDLYV